MLDLLKNNKIAIYGGLTSTIFTGLAIILLGNISGYEAKQLLENSLSGLVMLCNTIVLGSATILALLLTLISVSSGSDNTIKESHYKQVITMAKFDTILFISAMILFQLFNIPIIESETVPTSWYEIIYWATLIATCMLSGLMITVILMLYDSVTDLIAIIGLGKDHGKICDDEVEEKLNDGKEKIRDE